MSQQVLVFSNDTIQTMKQYYHHALIDIPQGAVFRAKTNFAVITAYRSGKVLFQGSAPEKEVEKWDKSASTSIPSSNRGKHKSPTTKSTYYSPPPYLFSRPHIGSDEAGTGDYFGPVTVASAYVDEEHIKILKEIGVQDSKKITDQTIQKLTKEILRLRIPYTLLNLHNEKYNKLQQQGWTQGKMKTLLHHHAIKKLLKKVPNRPLEGILIDQFCMPDVYKRHLSSENESLPNQTYFMTKAESYSIAVATGSIIARASFLKEMDKLSEQVGMELPKGASQKVDRAIAELIQLKGKDALSSCAKTHFANTQKANAYL